MKKNIWKLIVMIIAAAVLSLAAVAIADTVLWKWVDGKGNVHYAEYLDQVPEKYRSKAVKVVIKSKKSKSSSPSGGSSSATPKATKKTSKTAAERKNEKWRKKAAAAVRRVSQLENKVKALEKKCAELRQKYLVMPTIANNQASTKCYENLEKVKKDLEKARKYLETGIYEAAEKAGVPEYVIDEAIEEANSKSSKK